MHSRTARGRMAALVVFVAVLAGAAQASAAVSPNPIVRPFSVRYAINTNGDIAMAANTLLTCPTGALETQTHVSCADVQTGGFGDDNYFDMRYVDVDGDASTFDSSSANLTVPAGATVLFAGLYWGAALDQGETLPRAVRPEPAAHRLARGEPGGGDLCPAAGPGHGRLRPDQRERVRLLHRESRVLGGQRRRAHALPELRRRDVAREGRRRWHLHGRQRPGRYGRRPPRRLVARGRLPGLRAACPQPHDLRRLRAGRPRRQRPDHRQRLQDAAHRRGQHADRLRHLRGRPHPERRRRAR